MISSGIKGAKVHLSMDWVSIVERWRSVHMHKNINDGWVKDIPLCMEITKFSEVRVTKICHPFDGCVDIPHRFFEEKLLNEHKVIGMEVAAILPSHPWDGDW